MGRERRRKDLIRILESNRVVRLRCKRLGQVLSCLWSKRRIRRLMLKLMRLKGVWYRSYLRWNIRLRGDRLSSKIIAILHWSWLRGWNWGRCCRSESNLLSRVLREFNLILCLNFSCTYSLSITRLLNCRRSLCVLVYRNLLLHSFIFYFIFLHRIQVKRFLVKPIWLLSMWGSVIWLVQWTLLWCLLAPTSSSPGASSWRFPREQWWS